MKDSSKPMKVKNFPISCLLIILALSCGENEDMSEVNSFIKQLSSNQYISHELPILAVEDIEELLRNSENKREITNFPRNPISSFFQQTVPAGIIFLWTVESIRAQSIQSEFLIGRFPSQNPILKERKTGEMVLHLNNEAAYRSIATAYKLWWENNKGKSFEEFSSIDPLESTPYRWH